MTGLSIAVDLGGTNARCALIRDGSVDISSVKKYPNASYTSFADVLRTFMEESNIKSVDALCCAVAGPIKGDHAELTNLSWRLEQHHLAALTGAQNVALINDLQAQGYGILDASPDCLIPVRSGRQSGEKTRLVIGVGTGLNAAQVFETSTGLFVPPAEAGHTEMPAGSSRRLAKLYDDLTAKYGFASAEHVMSGRGVEEIYASQTKNRLSAADIFAGAAQNDAACLEAIDTSVEALGNYASDLALVTMPFAGLYLIGGVARAMVPYFGTTFETAFTQKGRFSEFMDQFPITSVDDDFLALHGCARRLSAG